eukprot:199019-Chlamydomonas_euryale.AAC.5
MVKLWQGPWSQAWPALPADACPPVAVSIHTWLYSLSARVQEGMAPAASVTRHRHAWQLKYVHSAAPTWQQVTAGARL